MFTPEAVVSARGFREDARWVSVQRPTLDTDMDQRINGLSGRGSEISRVGRNAKRFSHQRSGIPERKSRYSDQCGQRGSAGRGGVVKRGAMARWWNRAFICRRGSGAEWLKRPSRGRSNKIERWNDRPILQTGRDADNDSRLPIQLGSCGRAHLRLLTGVEALHPRNMQPVG